MTLASKAVGGGADARGENHPRLPTDSHLPPDLWRRLYGNDRPVAVEIGPGAGDFLFAAADTNPGVNFFAIERSPSRAGRLERRVEERRVTNVRVLRADATCVLCLLPDASVARYHVQFPDPWWKSRHARRRIWTAAFVAEVRRTLYSGGTIELVTDVADYFAYAESLLADEPGLERIDGGRTDLAATRFARKATARGGVIHRCLYRRFGAGCGEPVRR